MPRASNVHNPLVPVPLRRRSYKKASPYKEGFVLIGGSPSYKRAGEVCFHRKIAFHLLLARQRVLRIRLLRKCVSMSFPFVQLLYRPRLSLVSSFLTLLDFLFEVYRHHELTLLIGRLTRTPLVGLFCIASSRLPSQRSLSLSARVSHCASWARSSALQHSEYLAARRPARE